ncbi:MAG: hypothetical protein FK732_09985 [Asgard group archaeon]|nr:hypothetical protein [Asgard group archaeon]
MIREYSTRIIQEIECPFYKKGKLKVLYKPSMRRFTTSSSSSAGTKRKAYFTPEKHVIMSEKCPSCGKTKNEIERRLKDGPKLSHKEIIRRAKEAGLPLRF